MDLKDIQKILSHSCKGGNPVFQNSDLKVFYQQAQQNFNCVESSSCGRILDATAILLGFGEKNEYEGFLAEQLESNSNHPKSLFLKRDFIEPIIEKKDGQYILKTTELFQFLVKNLDKIPPCPAKRWRKNLATFVALYLADGLWQISQKTSEKLPILFSGGCAYSTIMTKYLLAKGVKINKSIPAGDGGISAGQIAYFLGKNKSPSFP